MSIQVSFTRLFLFPVLATALSIAGCDEADDDGASSEGVGDYGPEEAGDEDDGSGVDGPSCTNTCEYAHDDDCDDGGPGSDYSVCAFGSDCGDCGSRDGQAPLPTDDDDNDDSGSDEPPAQMWACEYVHHSRTACPGYPNDISETPRCVTVTAASSTEAEVACSEYTASDTDCYGSCCTRTYGTDRSLQPGGCG